MADAAALSLATDAAKGLGKVLMGRTIEEMKLMWGLKDELKKLQNEFSNLQRFLNDVGSAKHEDKRTQVNNWVLKVKDAVYVADDIIDDYDYEIIRREHEQKKQFLKRLQAFFTGNNPIVFRIRMSHRVRDALAMFDELYKNAQKMGLQQVEITKHWSANNDEGSARLMSEARKHASANDTEFVGRKEEMKKLLEKLCSPSNQEARISTVAIHGIGGIGKTTFARRVYDSEEIGAHFEKKLWISVGDNNSTIDATTILNQMLEFFTFKKENLSNTEPIINKLQENLKDKKYLLVLDDVWCKHQGLWSNLKNELQRIGGLPGSLILITTRLNDVTTGSQAVYTHSLSYLSEEEGWDLLEKRAFVGGTPPNFSSLKEIGKRIVKKCKGVPLAIKAIGGILQSKQLPLEWESIEDNDIWNLPQNDENQILPSLRLTYYHLPSPALKQCFAYCAAIGPKGYEMEKDELVYIWLAQGFLHDERKKKTMEEEIGEDYLMVLLNYSLLNEVTGEKKYVMHDLVYDLAVDVCGKDLLFWKPKSKPKPKPKPKPEDHPKIDSCRHLVYYKKDVEALSQLPITKTLGKLRTISGVGDLPPNVLGQAKYLRTLSADGCHILELPSSIGLLKHLRFLSLSDNPIETLPDSIGKLYLLQTLRLRRCFDMKILPAILYRLNNLIHVPTTTSMLASRGLRELSNLHTLPRLELGADEDGWSIDELGGLYKLMGKIHISGLEHVKTKENARKADLAGKATVSNITLAWDEERDEVSHGSSDEDVLDGLQPHPNITSLKLKNFFGPRFPSWMVGKAVVAKGGSSPLPLKNLSSLKLLNCRRCEMLPTLGHLPCLKYLVLSGLKVESIGNDFYGVPLNESNGSFPSLTKLKISNFKSLKTWVLPSTGEETFVFPGLEFIELTDCPELETIPALDYFQSLKKLELENVGIQSLDITKHKTSSMLSPEVNLKLETLEIDECEKLLSLPSELQYITSLKTMKLANCPALTSLPNNIPTNLEKRTSLATFTIEGPTPDFSHRSVNHVSFPSLIELDISYCGALKTCLLPPSADATNVFPRLEVLRVTNCPELEILPTLNFQSLRKVELENLGIRSFSIASQKVNMKLEELDFSHSSVNHVSFPSLTELKISNCGTWKTCVVPPSADATNVFPRLEVLQVINCPELETFPTLNSQSLKNVRLENVGIQSFSIASPKVNMKLEELDICYCEKLVSLPSELQFAASLKKMTVRGCPALTSLPNDLFQGLASLTELSICKCEALSNIPTSLGKCASLLAFTIDNCPSIKGPMPDFSNSSVNHVSFPSLTKLNISNCGTWKTCVVPPSADATNVFPRLEVLQVINCPELETFPTLNSQSLKNVRLENVGIQSFSIASPKVNMKLEALDIWKCEKLVSLPSELQFAASLIKVNVWDCPALSYLPNDLFHGLASLNELFIYNCEALSNIPTSLEKCASLMTLIIEKCPSIKGPMPDFSKLKSLQKMSKRGNSIELMISMLKAVEHLPHLTRLLTGEFKDEVEQEMYFSDVTPIQRSHSLRKLLLQGNPNIKSLPEQLQLLTQIKHLSIHDFDSLEELPKWVGRLSSLKELRLERCKKLKDIPSKEVFLQMTGLRELTIWECPFLKESCVKDVGSDWSKISHIPSIFIL